QPWHNDSLLSRSANPYTPCPSGREWFHMPGHHLASCTSPRMSISRTVRRTANCNTPHPCCNRSRRSRLHRDTIDPEPCPDRTRPLGFERRPWMYRTDQRPLEDRIQNPVFLRRWMQGDTSHKRSVSQPVLRGQTTSRSKNEGRTVHPRIGGVIPKV